MYLVNWNVLVFWSICKVFECISGFSNLFDLIEFDELNTVNLLRLDCECTVDTDVSR